ncbi:MULTISPECIES: hypothetical protein [unclassified Vibrio]|uniref:Uncharacterized protein n=1 Tax=Vibrio sp. HB236076 TaxID=3232307 RepID=A0AB39HF29_9VIBR|nr:hypothetical protein [Vibrio sp. HB161653]MDP5255236.1 hypothetical protein [Vibrio sp. HB161653]
MLSVKKVLLLIAAAVFFTPLSANADQVVVSIPGVVDVKIDDAKHKYKHKHKHHRKIKKHRQFPFGIGRRERHLKCRVIFPKRPRGHQPPPVDCYTLQKHHLPRNARVVVVGR